jgi:photosynthetic reaction center cytochrome c subunit
MVEFYNPRDLAAKASLNALPEDTPLEPSIPGGPKAADTFKNVKVVGELGVAEFTRLMVSMTNWVAPKDGCTYCHAADNFASDDKYTKVVARRMLEMTRHINTDWKSHVAGTGVTCYTCHRGEPVPAKVWFKPAEPVQVARMAGNNAGQNTPAATVGLSALPYDPFSSFLLQGNEIRTIGPTALATGNRRSIKQTEATYGLMVHMSESLGVNCTYCHNSRSFVSWDTSTPQRGVAWYGIRMARELNQSYLEPLTSTFPAQRRGTQGDVAKLNCETCHRGSYKPLNGAGVLVNHPELLGVAKVAQVNAPEVSK